MIQVNAGVDEVVFIEGMAFPRVTSLSASEVDEALVLAGLGVVDLEPGPWRRRVLAMLGNPADGGVLIARNDSGSACGLLMYRIVPDRSAKPSLEVERLVAFDLFRPTDIADRLTEEAIRCARLQDCDSLRLVRPLDAPANTALVLASGVAELHSVF